MEPDIYKIGELPSDFASSWYRRQALSLGGFVVLQMGVKAGDEALVFIASVANPEKLTPQQHEEIGACLAAFREEAVKYPIKK